MSEETKHSPLPWKTVGTSITGCDGKLITGGLWRVPTEADLANAALICRAVNAHEALVAACEVTLDALERLDPLYVVEPRFIGALINQLREAIKLAKEGKA